MTQNPRIHNVDAFIGADTVVDSMLAELRQEEPPIRRGIRECRQSRGHVLAEFAYDQPPGSDAPAKKRSTKMVKRIPTRAEDSANGKTVAEQKADRDKFFDTRSAFDFPMAVRR